MCFDAPVIRSLTRKFRLILLALLRSERFSFNDCLGGTAWVTFQTNSWKINPQNSEVHLRRPFIAASVLTYPVNPAYKICSPERNFLIRYESGIVWTLNPNILLSGDVTGLSPVLYLRYCIQESNLIPRFSQGRARCKFRALYDACSIVKSWVLEWIRILVGSSDTCGRANPIMDTFGRGNLWIREKKVRIQKYPDTCEHGA